MSALLRVLIVDDARLARQELRTLLSALPWVECVGEAGDVPAARDAIVSLAPDLVLLDVQMPSGSGFDVLEGLETVPAVVFVTAYDTYAVRAFQANALDYLVKPVEAPRLLEALQRARRCEVAAGDAPALRTTLSTALSTQDQVFVREGERCWFVAVSEIRRLVVEGNYTRVWFRDQNALLTRSLSALEARLPPELFFRAHRNTLVNLRCIRRVTPSIGDGYDLTLDDGSEVEVSRRQARELRERLAL
jgi:two-component system, LytTR family, response regulator